MRRYNHGSSRQAGSDRREAPVPSQPGPSKHDHSADPRSSAAPVLLANTQQALVERVAAVNAPGNLRGLFAHHVLHGDQEFPLSWNVSPVTPSWLAANADRARMGHTATLAALGYGLHHFAAISPSSAIACLKDGLVKLQRRDPFPEDRVSFAYDPVTFLGISLAVAGIDVGASDLAAWMAEVLDDPRCGGVTSYQALLYSYIRYVLRGELSVIDDLKGRREVTELALIEWCIRQGAFCLIDPRVDLSELQRSILYRAATTDVVALDADRAAVIWSAVSASLARSVADLVLSRGHVSLILCRFEAAMRRWRWDDAAAVNHPIRWEVTSEREVQDILWLILRSTFDDVVDEETLPKVGHSTYRADFGIPALRLLIEAKYARKAADFKAIEKEIMEDSVAYVLETKERYDRIIVFIFDESASVQEHSLTWTVLRRIPHIEDVIIVSRPSQLPGRA